MQNATAALNVHSQPFSQTLSLDSVQSVSAKTLTSHWGMGVSAAPVGEGQLNLVRI